MKYTKLLIAILLVGLTAVVARQVYFYFGRGTVTVTATPRDAAIIIDKTTYTTLEASNITLKPGTHRIIVALDGFTTIEQTITMGWQESLQYTYDLKPKSFKAIFQNLSPDTTNTNYQAVQSKFFEDNTWAAAYIIDNDGEGDVAVAVLKRQNGIWELVLYDHELPENTKDILPSVVYDYIKDFQQ